MTWGNLVARLGGLAVLMPLVLSRMSAEEVVLWYLFTTMTSLLVILDFGFSPTFSRLISYAFGGLKLEELSGVGDSSVKQRKGAGFTDWDTVGVLRRYIRNTYFWISIIGLVFTATVGSLAVFKPIANTDIPSFDAWFAWSIVAVSSTIQLYGMRFSSELQGANNIAIVQRWQMLTAFGALISAAIVLFFNYSMLLLVQAYYIWAIINVLILKRVSSIVFQSAKPSDAPSELKGIVRNTIWGPVWRSGFGILLSLGVIHSISVIYAQLAPAREVASYMLGIQAIQALSSFSRAPFYVKIPHMARLMAESMVANVVDVSRKAMRLSYAIYVVGFVLITLFVPPILSFIDSEVAFPEAKVWLLLGMGVIFERYGAMHIQMYSLTNKIIWHIANGITGLLIIVISFTLYPLLNVVAFPLAILLSNGLFYSWYSSSHSYGEFKQKFLGNELTLFIPALIAMTAFSTTFYLLVK